MLTQVLPQLAHKALIIQDVKDAVAAGKIVTISQSTISYKGWTGAGYSIVDPNTGAGAYLIGGGADGSFLIGFSVGKFIYCAILDSILVAMATGGAVVPLLLPLMGLFIAMTSAMSLIVGISILLTSSDKWSFGCFFSGLAVGLGLAGAIGAFSAGAPGGGLLASFGLVSFFGGLGWGYLPSAKQCLVGS